MEWIKLRSLRSTRWVLAGGMVATVALGVVAGYNTRSVTGDPTSNVLARTRSNGRNKWPAI